MQPAWSALCSARPAQRCGETRLAASPAAWPAKQPTGKGAQQLGRFQTAVLGLPELPDPSLVAHSAPLWCVLRCLRSCEDCAASYYMERGGSGSNDPGVSTTPGAAKPAGLGGKGSGTPAKFGLATAPGSEVKRDPTGESGEPTSGEATAVGVVSGCGEANRLRPGRGSTAGDGESAIGVRPK